MSKILWKFEIKSEEIEKKIRKNLAPPGHYFKDKNKYDRKKNKVFLKDW